MFIKILFTIKIVDHAMHYKSLKLLFAIKNKIYIGILDVDMCFK